MVLSIEHVAHCAAPQGQPRHTERLMFDTCFCADTTLAVDQVDIEALATCYEDGQVTWRLCGGEQCALLPSGMWRLCGVNSVPSYPQECGRCVGVNSVPSYH